MQKPLLTPKDLADAVGVSESSMRRWIDSGKLKITRTAGGHRRIEYVEAVRFIRESGTPVVRPEILRLGELTHVANDKVGDDGRRLYDALATGDRTLARAIAVSWHLQGHALASIFDGPFHAALERIGELWLHERGGIMVEHRAIDICIEIVHYLRSLLPIAPDGAPLAIGATPTQEWHSLPSQMAAAVSRECRLRDMNFGGSVPVDLLGDVARKHKAQVVWLSITMKLKRGIGLQIRRLADELQRQGTLLAVGGVQAHLPGRHDNMRVFASMSEFSAFLDGMRNVKPR